MAKALSIGVAVGALVVGGALVAVGHGGREQPLPRGDLDAVQSALDGAIRETAAGVRTRATTLAELPRLAAAVSTDAATVRDLTGEELAFRPKNGEAIAIGQLPTGGAPSLLLEIPDGAGRAVPLDIAGIHLEIQKDQLFVSDVEKVIPRERAAELTGALAVSWPVDLAAAKTQLDRLGVGAQITVGANSITLGAKPGDGAIALTLTGEPTREAKVLVAAPAAVTGIAPLEIGGGAVGLLGLVAAALLGRRRAPAATAPAPAATGTTTPPPVNPAYAATNPALSAPPKGRNQSSPSISMALASMPSGDEQTIGRYVVLKKLGSGGMAEVYLARAQGEAGFAKMVALKVMHHSLAVQPILVEHFLDEARLASLLTHPNIVQISDLGRAGDEYYIAMEYIEGADLERLLTGARSRGAPVPVQVGLTIIRKICDGLHAAHTAVDATGKALELVHRDVKAANVFIAKNGAVKVGDFGIAKVNQVSSVNKTEIGQVKGTAAYMAPEHRMGQPIDRRADLYAVGAIAYEVLSGDAVDLDLLKLVTQGKEGWPHLAPLNEVRPELPPGLSEVVLKALAYERDQRWSSCAEMEEALEKIANQHGLVGSDKAVALWAAAELKELKSDDVGGGTGASSV